MEMKTLNYLLQKVYKKEYESFNLFYDFSHRKIKAMANKMYKDIIKKDLYSIEDLIQEIWLQLLLQLTSKELKVSCLNEFNDYLCDTVNTVLAKINE